MNYNIDLPPKKNTIALIVIAFIALFEVWLFYALATGYVRELSFFNALFPIKQTEQQPLQSASLEFLPIKNSYKKGEKTITGIVFKSSQVKIGAFGLVFRYNPSTMKIISFQPSNLINSVVKKNNDAKKGIYTAALLIDPGEFLEESGEIASIEWEPVAEGTAYFRFDFTPGSTTDTNVAEFATGKDALTSIVNADYTIE